jgi:hypothetical protein
MSRWRSLAAVSILALLVAGSLVGAEEPPQLLPTRDVDITYDVTRPQEPKIRERARWLAADHLERIDGPDKSATIFDRNTHEITLLTSRSHSYRKLEGQARQPPEPATGMTLKRGGEAVVAGLHCTEWTWTDDVEMHTACITADGVLLRLGIDGQTIMEARSVQYGRQSPELVQVPPDYTPALAPEGGPAE